MAHHLKKVLILNFLYILFLSSYAQNRNLIDLVHKQEGEIESCYSQLENDTLTIGNAFLERQYKWNSGKLIPINIQNKITGQNILFENKSISDFGIKGLTKTIVNAKYAVKTIEKSTINPQHLQIEILSVYDSIEIKRVFRIYPASMAIACDFYLKSKIDNIEIKPEDIKAENLFLPSLHWRLKSVEFFDDTDYHNNLVREEEVIAFRDIELKGNILFADNILNSSGLFILKEAPCSFVQNNYPGYDFKNKWSLNKPNIEIISTGLGIAGSDLIKNEWTKCFGYTVGVHDNTRYTKMIALRSYQNNLRTSIPERDEFVMVNTWGDRNKTTKIKADFILEEIELAKKFGFTHYMIDAGWQAGRSIHSVEGGLLSDWETEDWLPRKDGFPDGLNPIVKLADSLNIKLGLWFQSSWANDNAKWEQDADIIIGLYKQYGIKYIKVDGVRIPTMKADLNLQKFFNKVLDATNGEVVFIFDVTADNRFGYHYNNHIGKIFLENRYSDWRNYYPYRTLRNIWMLSSYVPLQNFHIEFLNKWRSEDKYGNDPLAPSQYSFDYLFAITIPSQPLAWFETTGLPEEAEESIDWFKLFSSINADLHDSFILPVGNEPDGTSFTGFQFMKPENEGYILVFRELNKNDKCQLNTMFEKGDKIRFKKIYGNGKDFKSVAGNNGKIEFKLTDKNSFCLYKYKF